MIPITQIEILVNGYHESKNSYLFTRNLSFKVHEVIDAHGEGRPTLVVPLLSLEYV